MMRRLWTVLSIFVLMLALFACNDSQDAPEDTTHLPSTGSYDFKNLAEEYDVPEGAIDLHFYEEGVPYVDIEAFIELIDGAIMSETIETNLEDDGYMMHYTLEAGEGEEGIYEDTTMELTMDIKADSLTVNRLSFFNGFSEATKTDFGETLEVSDYDESIGDPLTIPLSEYSIEIIEDDDAVLLPFNVANLFFSGSMYDVYFNGDALYGVDTYQMMDDTEVRDTLNDSSKTSVETPDSLKQHTLDYLALSFDYFYGLKTLHGIQTYYDELDAFEDTLMGSDTEHYRAIFDFAFTHDDIHTSPLMEGYYEEPFSFQASFSDIGPRTTAYYEALYDETLNTHCDIGSDITYNSTETKAMIKVDRFDEETLGDFETFMNAVDDKDTIEDVVIDLSCNGGGIIGIMIQMLGYMTDDPVAFHTKNASDDSTSATTYSVDINARDYNFHLLSSPLSFSAANSMLSIAKENDLATIIGQKSSGGASSVMTNITPSGSVLIMSSPSVMTDSTYESIEYGVSVDQTLPLQSIPDAESVFDALP